MSVKKNIIYAICAKISDNEKITSLESITLSGQKKLVNSCLAFYLKNFKQSKKLDKKFYWYSKYLKLSSFCVTFF